MSGPARAVLAELAGEVAWCGLGALAEGAPFAVEFGTPRLVVRRSASSPTQCAFVSSSHDGRGAAWTATAISNSLSIFLSSSARLPWSGSLLPFRYLGRLRGCNNSGGGGIICIAFRNICLCLRITRID